MAWPSGSVIGADDPYSFEIPRPQLTPALTVGPGSSIGDEVKRVIARLRAQVGTSRPLTTVRTNPRTGKPEAVAGVDNSLQHQAELVAAGLLDPQLAEINRLIAAKQQQELARGKAYEGVQGALSAANAGIPEGIRSAYAGAADRVSGYASGLTGAGAEAAQRAAQEAGATIAGVGLAGSSGPVASEGGAIASSVNYTGGFLPAANLAAEAASRMAEASTMNMAGNARLAEEALQAMRATQDEVAELQARGLDLEMTRPAQIQKALADMRSEDREERQMKLQERAFQVQVGELQLARAKTAWDRAEALTNLTGYVHTVKNGKVVRTREVASGSDAFTSAQTQAGLTQRAAAKAKAAAAKTAAANKKPDNALSKTYGYIVDSNGNAILKNGKRQPVTTGAGGTKPPTPATISTTIGRAQTAGQTALKTVVDRIGANTPPPKDDSAGAKAAARAEFARRLKLNRGSLMASVTQAIGPHLRAIGWTTARIQQEAKRIVDAKIAAAGG